MYEGRWDDPPRQRRAALHRPPGKLRAVQRATLSRVDQHDATENGYSTPGPGSAVRDYNPDRVAAAATAVRTPDNDPCGTCMVLSLFNSACGAGVHTPTKPVCGSCWYSGVISMS